MRNGEKGVIETKIKPGRSKVIAAATGDKNPDKLKKSIIVPTPA